MPCPQSRPPDCRLRRPCSRRQSLSSRYCAQGADPDVLAAAAAGPWTIDSRKLSRSSIQADVMNSEFLWSGIEDVLKRYPFGTRGITQSFLAGGVDGLGFEGGAFGGGALPAAELEPSRPPAAELLGPVCCCCCCARCASASLCCWSFIILIGEGSQAG